MSDKHDDEPKATDEAQREATEPDQAPGEGGETAPVEEETGPISEGTQGVTEVSALDRVASRPELRRGIRAQWRDAVGEPVGDRIVLRRTVADDPRGMALASIRPRIRDGERTWMQWEVAQLASDATAIGRLYRPAICLLPIGRRWYAVRSFGGDALLVTLGRSTAVRALRDAELRYLAWLVRPPVAEGGRREEAEADNGTGTRHEPSGVSAPTTEPDRQPDGADVADG